MEYTGSQITDGAISPSSGLVGTCDLPGDADLSIMAMAVSSNADGVSRIHRCSRKPEVGRTSELLTSLGISVAWDAETATVTGGCFRAPADVLHVDGSLVLFSCLAGLLSNAPFVTRLSGVRADAGVERLFDALRSLGACPDVSQEDGISACVGGDSLTSGTYRAGFPDPVVKCGMLMAGVGVDGTVELVQDKTGDEDLEVLLQAAGCGLKKRRIRGARGRRLTLEGPARLRGVTHELPGSSDAALVLALSAAMLRRSELTVTHFGLDSISRRIVDLLRRMNVSMDMEQYRTDSGFPVRRVRIRSSELRGIKIAGAAAGGNLDALPLLAAAGAVSRGETIIRNAEALRDGEVDCISVLVDNLRKMQVQVGEMPDGLVVKGGQPQGAELDAAGDARVTLALTLAALASEGETHLMNPGPVDRMYPGIMERLAAVLDG